MGHDRVSQKSQGLSGQELSFGFSHMGPFFVFVFVLEGPHSRPRAFALALAPIRHAFSLGNLTLPPSHLCLNMPF